MDQTLLIETYIEIFKLYPCLYNPKITGLQGYEKKEPMLGCNK